MYQTIYYDYLSHLLSTHSGNPSSINKNWIILSFISKPQNLSLNEDEYVHVHSKDILNKSHIDHSVITGYRVYALNWQCYTFHILYFKVDVLIVAAAIIDEAPDAAILPTVVVDKDNSLRMRWD